MCGRLYRANQRSTTQGSNFKLNQMKMKIMPKILISFEEFQQRSYSTYDILFLTYKSKSGVSFDYCTVVKKLLCSDFNHGLNVFVSTNHVNKLIMNRALIVMNVNANSPVRQSVISDHYVISKGTK